MSVVVPAFNVESWLEQCLRSITSQTYRNLEIIVIDDGSTDSTPRIIEEFASSDARIRAVAQQNRGLSVVRNRGMRLAEGQILLFVDSDDWLHPGAVAQIVQVFVSRKVDLVMYQCAKYYDDNGAWSSGSDDYYWSAISRRHGTSPSASETPEMLSLYPLAQLKAISRSFVSGHGLAFIEGIRYEDNPFHVQLFSLNPKVGFLPRKFYAWRQNRQGQITGKPHVEDCGTAVSEMLRTGQGLDEHTLPHLLVAVSRLVGTVARLIEVDAERKLFLTSFRRKLLDWRGSHLLNEILGHLTASAAVHPGDKLLARGLCLYPDDLGAALGSGADRYIGALRCLRGPHRASGRWPEFREIIGAAKNGRLLYHYAKGIGESKVDAFGPDL